LVVEDFKNEKGEWVYGRQIQGKRSITVGGGYFNSMKTRCKRVAEEYKDQIDPRVYLALLDYTVEIDD